MLPSLKPDSSSESRIPFGGRRSPSPFGVNVSSGEAALSTENLPSTLMAGLRMVDLDKKRVLGFPASIFWSSASHLGVVAAIFLFLLIAQLLGWVFPLFDPLSLKQRELEFVLVETPEAKPRDPNTRLRAEKNSRSGGKAVKNLPKAQPLKSAGAPNQPRQAQPVSKPQPKPQPSRPQPQPQPVKSQQQPVERPVPKAATQPSPKPAPTPPAPAPKAAVPKPSNTKAQSVPMPPPPGAINLPSTPAPKQIASGPVLPTSGGVSGGRGSASSGQPGQSGGGRPGPMQIPGNVSPGGGASPGGMPGGGGNNGRNNTNQFGSPGGGGGNAGIDAIAEPDFGPYIAELQRRIKRNWTPPSDNRNKRIVALFTIGRDGNLRKLVIQKSSGVASADDAAVAAVRASSPFRPLPANYRGNEIDVQFIFDYNVYSGRGNGVSLQ